MPLNQVQRDFVNQAARPHMEEIVKALHILDVFVADYDALQATEAALPTDTTVLDDGSDGTSPRSDAPILTGVNLLQLRNFSENMSAVVNAVAKEVLIGKMVRPLAIVLRVQ